MKKTIISMIFVIATNYAFGSTYKSSRVCMDFIKNEEKCSLTAYWDSNGYSIGYGHHSNVRKTDKITHTKAITYLKEDIKSAEKYVNHLLNKLPYKYKFSQGFIDGFTSFVYNVGVGNAQNSTFYKRLQRCRVKKGVMNKSDFDFAVAAIKRDCITSKGHIERRNREYKLIKG